MVNELAVSIPHGVGGLVVSRKEHLPAIPLRIRRSWGHHRLSELGALNASLTIMKWGFRNALPGPHLKALDHPYWRQPGRIIDLSNCPICFGKKRGKRRLTGTRRIGADTEKHQQAKELSGNHAAPSSLTTGSWPNTASPIRAARRSTSGPRALDFTTGGTIDLIASSVCANLGGACRSVTYSA